MNSVALYHRLPYPLKVAAASAHGFRLRGWRYGRDTEELIEACLARETWSPARWTAWREERLGRLLEAAAQYVPAYRGLDPSDFEAWPRLTKQTLRQRPLDFVDSRHDPRRLYAESTSGTSGTPLRLFWSRRTAREWYAFVEARSRLWYGVSRHDRWAILGGQLVAAAARRKPPFWVWNAGLHQLYLSSYHLSAPFLSPYLDAMAKHRVRYLWGYTSALATLAALTLEAGQEDRGRALGLKVAIANAEPVTSKQRQLVAEAFGCPLRETYGMAELVAAASECEHGYLHLWPEIGHLELLDEGKAQSGGASSEAGRLIATGLLAEAQPLVRYETGDRLRLEATATCPCGRTLPLLAAVEGRVDDVIVTPDGRRIGRLDPIFKADLPIVEAQIIQTDPSTVRVLYVPTSQAGKNQSLEARIRDRVAERLPGLEIEIEARDQIPRGANGKFRAVIGLASSAPDRAKRRS